eukprot:6233863-Lingulodinium_polyedra.AAC.1
MLQLSREDFMKYAGIKAHESKLGTIATEVRRMLRGVRWPRPVRLDPDEVPEERRNYACVHGASIRSRQFGARGCHAGPSGTA